MKFTNKCKKLFVFKYIVIFSILFLMSCRSNPHNDPPVQGDIRVTLNTSNQMCFEPNFKDARIGSNVRQSKPYTIVEASNVTFDLYNSNGDLIWELLPSQQPVTFKSGEIVCINGKDSRFNEKKYSSIVQDKKYGINMRANTTDNSRRVFFSTKFFYKDNLIKYSE